MMLLSNRDTNEALRTLNQANKVFEFELERALREACAQAEQVMNESNLVIPTWTGDWLTYAQALNTAGGNAEYQHCQDWASEISDEIEQSFTIKD